MAYKIPKDDARAMHFAFVSTFGMKEPIFSGEHLSLCEDMTLLLLKRGDDGIPLLLHTAKDGKFSISFGVCKCNKLQSYLIQFHLIRYSDLMYITIYIRSQL